MREVDGACSGVISGWEFGRCTRERGTNANHISSCPLMPIYIIRPVVEKGRAIFKSGQSLEVLENVISMCQA